MREPQPGDIPADAKASLTEQWQRPYRFVIAGLITLLNISFGLSFFAVAPITPLIIDDYGINRSMAGLLSGLVLLVQAGLSIPGSMLVGRVPLKWLIAAGWVLTGSMTLSFLTTSFPLLLLLRVLYALGFTLALPALGPLMMQWFHPRELPLINGINISVASGAIAVSTFTISPLADVVGGWRVALSLFGVVSLAGAGMWMVFGKVDRPIQGRRHLLFWKEARGLFRSRITLLLAMADAGPFAQYVALSAWLPTFYFEVHNMSLTQAGAAVGLLPATGAITVLLAGMLALRVRNRRPFLIISGVLAVVAGFGSFLLGGTVAMYPALVLLGIGSWLYLPILLTIPMERPGMTPESVAFVWATIISLGSLLSFVSPLVVGALTDALGTYIPGFSIFTALALSLVIAGFLLPETGRSRA